MKRQYLILFIAYFISITSYSQMKENRIGWALFINTGENDFSESFQIQMSNQLMQKFNYLVGIENYANDRKFWIVVGIPEIKITQKDGFAFITVLVHCPNNETKQLSVYWKAEDNIKIISDESILPEHVNIGWCHDFDKEYFLSFLSEDIIENLNDTKLNFKFTYHTLLYPDLIIEYKFKSKPSVDELNEIKRHVKKMFKRHCFSDIEIFNGNYFTGLDFQNTNFKKGNNQIERFIFTLNRSKISKKIEHIIIK